MANYLAVNADNFIVGRLLGATSLGLYARAFNLMNLPYVYVASVLSGVLFPAFSQIQTDIPRLRRGYLTMTMLTAVIAGPSMVALAIAAPFLVPTLYGPAWAGVVLPLQILCAAGYFRSLFHVGSIVAKSVGRVYSDLQRQVGYAIVVVCGAIAGSFFELPGVAVGVGVAIVLMFIATEQLALEITRTSWTQYLRAQRGAILTTTFVALFAIGARVALEHIHARAAFIAAGTLIAAALPWCVGLLWHLGEADLAVIVHQLPPDLGHLVHFLRRISASTENFRG
jgi:PST family polysaccharide transporter